VGVEIRRLAVSPTISPDLQYRKAPSQRPRPPPEDDRAHTHGALSRSDSPPCIHQANPQGLPLRLIPFQSPDPEHHRNPQTKAADQAGRAEGEPPGVRPQEDPHHWGMATHDELLKEGGLQPSSLSRSIGVDSRPLRQPIHTDTLYLPAMAREQLSTDRPRRPRYPSHAVSPGYSGDRRPNYVRRPIPTRRADP